MLFTRKNVQMHLAGCSYKTEAITDDVTGVIAAIRLSLEPLTPALAKELGPDIAAHCFTDKGQIRQEMTQLRCRIRPKPQKVTARMAADVDEHAVLRQVRFKYLTVAKRGEEQGEKTDKKNKKVSPQKEVLRVTLHGLVDMAEGSHRDFLGRRFGDTLFFTLEDEAQALPLETRETEDDEPADDDAGAALPLEDGKKKGKGKKKGPRLVKPADGADETKH